MDSVTIKDLHDRTDELIEFVIRHPSNPIKVTNRGKLAILLVNADYLDSLLETLDILSDQEAVKLLKRGMDDIKAGRVISHEEVGRRLGLHGNGTRRRGVVAGRLGVATGNRRSVVTKKDLRKGKRAGTNASPRAHRKTAA
jgi:PHD/YefM family antitoxin component YafN of YafNO toxin-antitoxin module